MSYSRYQAYLANPIKNGNLLITSIRIILKQIQSKMSNSNRHHVPQQIRYPNMNPNMGPVQCPCQACRQMKRNYEIIHRPEMQDYMQRYGFDYPPNSSHYPIMPPQAMFMYQNSMRNYFYPDPSTQGFINGNPMSMMGMGMMGMSGMGGMPMNGMNPMAMHNGMQRMPQSVQRYPLMPSQQHRQQVICLDSDEANNRMQEQDKPVQDKEQEKPHERLRSVTRKPAQNQEQKSSLAVQQQKMVKQEAQVQRRVQPPRKKFIQKIQKPEQTRRERIIKEDVVSKVQQRMKTQRSTQQAKKSQQNQQTQRQVNSNAKQKQYALALQKREIRLKEEQKERREAIKYQESHGRIRIGKDFQSCLPAYLLNQQQLMIWKQEKKHSLLQRQIQSTNYF